MNNKNGVGRTQDFVVAKGFDEQGFLIGADNTVRAFIELVADTDDPSVRPQEAWRTLMHALPVGWALRIYQIMWPDATARQTFARLTETWSSNLNEGVETLWEAFQVFLQKTTLPFFRRTVIEIAAPPAHREDLVSFVATATAIFENANVGAKPLAPADVEALAAGVLNPTI